MAMRETVGGQVITTTGAGSFSPNDHSGSMTMRFNLPGVAGVLGALDMRVVISGETIYMRMPAEIAARIPGGRPWWKLNLGSLGAAEGIPGLGSMMSGTSSLSDPSQMVDYLRAVSAGSVEDLGHATVNGIATTHYRAEIDLARVPRAVPAASRKDAEAFVAALEKRFATGTVPIDAWVDAAHRVRRVAMDYTVSPVAGGPTVRVALVSDFTHYGPQPPPATPPPGQTSDILSLLHDL